MAAGVDVIYQGALREIGAKRPSGPSLKLLNVIDTKGVDVQS
jgi:DNA-binding transcriptional regulator YiaG